MTATINYANADPASDALFPKFAHNLADLMQKGTVSRTTLALSLEISTAAIGKYLRGEALPGPESLRRLSEFFRVPREVFLEDLPEPARKQALEGRAIRFGTLRKQLVIDSIVPEDSPPKRPPNMTLRSFHQSDVMPADIRRQVESEVMRRVRTLTQEAIDEHMPEFLSRVYATMSKKLKDPPP